MGTFYNSLIFLLFLQSVSIHAVATGRGETNIKDEMDKTVQAISDSGSLVHKGVFPDNGPREPKIIKVPRLEYPSAAKKAGLEGKVYLKILIDLKGVVSQVQVVKSSGAAILDSAAVNTAKKYKFAPAKVRLWYGLPLEFKLKPEEKPMR
jgi:TonB family protein